jgi:hypothetical protein
VATTNGVDALPTEEVEDERTGFNLEMAKKWGRHTTVLGLNYSTESDYESRGISIRDGIDFNKKNTTLNYGVAYLDDVISASTMPEEETKQTYDFMIGLTQVLDRNTLASLNLTWGRSEGYLTDPYKGVELNGDFVAERRPEDKDKLVVYLSLSHYIESLRGAWEAGLRYYDDTFGIQAQTLSASWHQHLSDTVVLSPVVRFYQQTAADFYGVRFSGDPEFYSADYRLSRSSRPGVTACNWRGSQRRTWPSTSRWIATRRRARTP